jgi:PAS domain S-box-containing protein
LKNNDKIKKQPVRALTGRPSGIYGTAKSDRTRKKAEDAYWKSEQKYKALIETTGTGYLILDPAGKVVDANSEYVRLSGHDTLKEIIGRSVVEWTADHDRARNRVEVAKCLEQGFVRGLEIDYVDQEGRITPIEIHATVIRKGASFQIISLCRDITERKQTEYALRLSEEKLSKAFQVSPDWISISTWEEGRYIDVNAAYLRLSGYRRDEVVGHTSMEINLWENPDDRKKAFQIIEKNGALKDFEVQFKMKSGKKRLMLWSAEVIEMEGEKFILSVCQDITESKRAQEELRESEERFRLLVENAPDAIFIQTQGKFAYVNKAAVGLFGGKSQGQFLGQPVMNRFHPDYHQAVQERIRLLNEEREDVPPLEQKYLKLDGTSFDVEVSAVPFLYENQKGALVFFRDITARKQAAEELQKAKEDLEMRVEERTAVLQNVNRKLRTELTERNRVEEELRKSKDKLRFLSGQLIHAQEQERKRISFELHDDLGQSMVGLKFQLCNLPKKLRPDQKALRATIEEAIKNLDGMTEKVRRLSKDLRPAVLEYLGLFEALQWLIEDSSKTYGLKVSHNLRKTKYSFSKEQEINIFRIFQESLTNVGKHAEATQVLIEMTEHEKETVFSIKDDGKGFNRKGITDRNPIDIGLGLTSMDERSRLIGGTIEIKSHVGQGTALTFTVPVEQKPQKSKPTRPSRKPDKILK